MKTLICFTVLQVCSVFSEIRDSIIINKLSNVKPVGGMVGTKFMPLTEIPPPKEPHVHVDGRRHFNPDCDATPSPRIAYEGPQVGIFGEYYDEGIAKTVANIIIPDHIDHKHFEVTSQVPYLTLGQIEALGYHPSTVKSEYPPECEKIYQDHMDHEYTEEDVDISEESLEMARMPLMPEGQEVPESIQDELEKLYDD